MNPLEILTQHRDAILLAEVAAWLHMFGKFHEEFLRGNHDLDIQIPQDIVTDYPVLDGLLRNDWTGRIWQQMPVLDFNATTLSFFDLIKEHRSPNASSGLARLMWDAHGRGSGIEKGVLDRFALGQNTTVYPATAVGQEMPCIKLDDLEKQRKILYSDLQTWLQHLRNTGAAVDWSILRKKLFARLNADFRSSVAETRRPLNDVTLFDQTAASVALFKAAIVQNLLNGWKEPNQKAIADKYKWRVLRIGLEGLQFWGQSVRISDLLARKEQFTQVFDQTKKLIEETYPLGTEIYRDENGSLFVLPDLAGLLGATIAGNSLENHLQQIVDTWLANEATFTLDLSAPTRTMLTFGQLATAALPIPSPNSHELQKLWNSQEPRDICPVCNLRPQGTNVKAVKRKLCDVCEQRRNARSRQWVGDLTTTIWTDEVADNNGRLALIVGQFGLDSWLTGKSFSSILAFDPTTRTLKDEKRGDKEYQFQYSQLLDDMRNAIRTRNFKGGTLLDNLVLNNVRDGSFENFYDSQVNDTDLSNGQTGRDSTLLALAMLRQNPSFARIRRVWETTRTFWQQVQDQTGNGSLIPPAQPRLAIHPQTPHSLNLGPFHTYELVLNGIHLSVVWDAPNQRFITCDNLDYLAKPEQLGQSVAAIITPGKTFVLEEPAGYGSISTQVGKITIDKVAPMTESYAPTIPILAEPRTFMTLVPADKALDVINAIKTKYEREMGKVRNRLPLHLGAVYFGRRIPLAAALDAGRRMLKRPSQTVFAEVVKPVPTHLPADPWPANATLTLKLGDRKITLEIPTVMGDGTTKDVWYPYWQVTGKPNDRRRWFAGADGEHWVHVCDLRAGDPVSFTPSTFDYEWLDTTARRFEVAYTPAGQRRGSDKQQRPYLLEEIPLLAQAWQEIRVLATSQIKVLEATLEGKRRDWQEPTGCDAVSPTFHQFIDDLLRKADVYSDSLAQSARTGLLTDALELYLTINKNEPDKITPNKETK